VALTFTEASLSRETVSLARGCDAVCIFVNDKADAEVIGLLAEYGVKLIALRCAGFNNVDLQAAKENGLCVVRVPGYSPYAVAEHTVALVLALNRKIHRAHNRVREGNFSLQGLLGFDLHGKQVGIIGTGRIGQIAATIFRNGFGCEVLAYDLYPNEELIKIGVRYGSTEEVIASSDIISLHCPLTPETFHLINEKTIALLKPGAMLINTSRGGLIDASAVIEGLKTGRVGALGIDVYEEEGDLFFKDLSGEVIRDDTFARLTTFPNVLITGHQGFFTKEALTNIADTTLRNIIDFEERHQCENAVTCSKVQ
jgi:D-lactate dehydrogenase